MSEFDRTKYDEYVRGKAVEIYNLFYYAIFKIEHIEDVVHAIISDVKEN